jgi:hypothetical protein
MWSRRRKKHSHLENSRSDSEGQVVPVGTIGGFGVALMFFLAAISFCCCQALGACLPCFHGHLLFLFGRSCYFDAQLVTCCYCFVVGDDRYMHHPRDIRFFFIKHPVVHTPTWSVPSSRLNWAPRFPFASSLRALSSLSVSLGSNQNGCIISLPSSCFIARRQRRSSATAALSKSDSHTGSFVSWNT